MESFYVTCHNVHLDILHALALGLGLPETYLQDLCRDNTSELRLNHYPACSASQIGAGAMRISEHTDFGTVTLLFQDSVGGLEVEDQQRRGDYFPVPAENKYDLIVNIGDCLQRWTNDKFRSTSHRVTVPPVVVGEWLDDRYSVAYFAKPSRDQSVGPLREFVEDGEAKYDDITAWEYNQQKLTRTY
jgi:isopenicillin N synthase-like dioxygenase